MVVRSTVLMERNVLAKTFLRIFYRPLMVGLARLDA